MNKSKLAFHVSVLTLSLLILGGCNSEDDATVAAEVAGRGAVQSPPDDRGAGNSAPVIWGDPAYSATVGATYLFQPDASDSDGDVLEFSVANKPEWANFDSLTGGLQGIPGSDDVGQNANVVISVSDQISVSSLASFTIQVDQVFSRPDAGGGDGTVSAAPTISGTPNTSAVVNSLYSFLPETSDADGDELSFSIVNKPAWASFDTTTGQLEGTPTSADVGTTNAIELSVTDGSSIAALDKFGITVEQAGPSSFTISWTAPTQNEDGTALTDLAGYRIYYGTTTARYSEEVTLNSPGTNSYVIENLAAGKYFLVMTSVNSGGVESKYTPEISFDLGG
jgi:hypothetical protein